MTITSLCLEISLKFTVLEGLCTVLEWYTGDIWSKVKTKKKYYAKISWKFVGIRFSGKGVHSWTAVFKTLKQRFISETLEYKLLSILWKRWMGLKHWKKTTDFWNTASQKGMVISMHFLLWTNSAESLSTIRWSTVSQRQAHCNAYLKGKKSHKRKQSM